MNKDKLAQKIADEKGITKADALSNLNDVFDTISDSLINGETVSIVNFGSFEVRTRKARSGRNPQTGAEIQIPEQKAIGFKVGKGLREGVKKL